MSFVDHNKGIRDGLAFDAGKNPPPVVSYFQVTFFPGYLNYLKAAKVLVNAVTHLRVEELMAYAMLFGNAHARADSTKVAGGINPLDFRFNKVHGLSSTLETDVIVDGGFNNEVMHMPSRISHENLVLERGFVHSGLSLTSKEFSVAMNLFTVIPGEILVTLNDPDQKPLEAWLFRNAIPVAWENTSLESDESDIFMESMEFAYSHRHQLYTNGNVGHELAHILY